MLISIISDFYFAIENFTFFYCNLNNATWEIMLVNMLKIIRSFFLKKVIYIKLVFVTYTSIRLAFLILYLEGKYRVYLFRFRYTWWESRPGWNSNPKHFLTRPIFLFRKVFLVVLLHTFSKGFHLTLFIDHTHIYCLKIFLHKEETWGVFGLIFYVIQKSAFHTNVSLIDVDRTDIYILDIANFVYYSTVAFLIYLLVFRFRWSCLWVILEFLWVHP